MATIDLEDQRRGMAGVDAILHECVTVSSDCIDPASDPVVGSPVVRKRFVEGDPTGAIAIVFCGVEYCVNRLV